MSNSEVLWVYNPLAGNQSLCGQEFRGLGVQAVLFLDLLENSSDYITPEIMKVIVSGGDGTFFTVARLLAESEQSGRKIEMLMDGRGSENVGANVAGTVYKPDDKAMLVTQFLAGELASRPLKPFQFTTPDGQKDVGFWSVGVGAIAPIILDKLEELRFVKDPTLRKAMATIAMMMKRDKSRTTAVMEDGSQVAGWDVAFISSLFPFWPKFLDVEKACKSPSSGDGYLLRFGKEGQTLTQVYAGLIIDFAALQLFGRTATNTLYVESITTPSIEMTAPDRIISVDSVILHQKVSGKVQIDQTHGKKLPTLNLAYVPKSKQSKAQGLWH